MRNLKVEFAYIGLFAGIGEFRVALDALGSICVGLDKK